MGKANGGHDDNGNGIHDTAQILKINKTRGLSFSKCEQHCPDFHL
jgi:hypothetical protein